MTAHLARARKLVADLFGRGWRHLDVKDIEFGGAYVCIGEVTQINYRVHGAAKDGNEYAHEFKTARPTLYIRGDGKAAVLYKTRFTPRGFL